MRINDEDLTTVSFPRNVDHAIMIGVDSGGTFTDTVVTLPTGRIVVGKSLSTPGAVEDGVINSINAAAEAAGMTLDALVRGTSVITHGTTVGLNAILTGSGARVGLITTQGFESTLAIAKGNKVHGLDDVDALQPTRWRKPSPLLSTRDIVGVPERIDRNGTVIHPLDESATREAIRYLSTRGVESIAVGLLWSCTNPSHERRIGELIAEEAPHLPTSLSSTVAPVVGEYERFTTTVMDASISEVVSSYLDRLEQRLRGYGFDGNLMVLRTSGGSEPVEQTQRTPVNSLRSGPVAGLIASADVGALLGHDKVIATDVGGTSFDIGLVVGGQPERSGRPLVDRHPLAVPAIEVVSIGTGGGSLAWFDRELGALRVGPQSAGASPGPACYGQGGTLPTVTDAAVTLGYVDRLGSSMQLDIGAAREAIDREVAKPLGMSTEQAAEGIVRVASDQMKDLIRRTTIQRGFDPSSFALFAYGGAGPQYAAWYCEGLGLEAVIVPRFAAEFSAFGAATSEIVVSAEHDLFPIALEDSAAAADEVFAALDAEVDSKLQGNVVGLDEALGSHFSRRRELSLRFLRQQRRIDLPVETWEQDSLDHLAKTFRTRYEEVTGSGTAPLDSPIEIVGARVSLTLPLPLPTFDTISPMPAGQVACRDAWFDGAMQSCPVHEWGQVGQGQSIAGPAFVESEQSTLVVPPGCTALFDPSGHVHLTWGAQHA